MALVQVAARQVIASAHMNAIYGLFKGVAGQEDTVLIVNNASSIWTFKAKSPDPAADTILFSIQDSSGNTVWSLTYDGQVKVRTANPYHRFKDMGSSGADWRWYNVSGLLKMQQNTGTEVAPVWTDRVSINIATGAINTVDVLASYNTAFVLSAALNW